MGLDFDQRLSLDLEQGVMLWCVRAWIEGLERPEGSTEQITTIVDCLGASEAAPYLEGFMFAISHGALRKIGIACTCCARIAPDERLLLDVLGMAQQGRPLEATMLLRGIVTPQGAQAAIRSAEGLGTELALAGWFLAAPDAAVSHYAMAPGFFDDTPFDATRPLGAGLDSRLNHAATPHPVRP